MDAQTRQCTEKCTDVCTLERRKMKIKKRKTEQGCATINSCQIFQILAILLK